MNPAASNFAPHRRAPTSELRAVWPLILLVFLML